MLVYLLIKFKFHYLPESIAIVVLGEWGEGEWRLKTREGGGGDSGGGEGGSIALLLRMSLAGDGDWGG